MTKITYVFTRAVRVAAWLKVLTQEPGNGSIPATLVSLLMVTKSH